jgi:hypothetical protein
MKPLFQFTTVKPNAATIWGTLCHHDITATSGYTVDEIRFYMFVVLQLREDFKAAKELCNNYESRTTELYVAVKDLLVLPSAQPASPLRVPPADLPLWVDHMLYIPYYMMKQLGAVKADLWGKLFDRETATEMEENHLVGDLRPISKSITAYKLWYYGNDIIAEKYSDIFAIHDNFVPEMVTSQLDVRRSLGKYMYDYLEDSDNHIFDYSRRISIKPFTLGGSDAPQ